MSKEKQIEEMVRVIADVPPINFPFGSRMRGKHVFALSKIAEYLYNAGFRKQSERDNVEWISVRDSLPDESGEYLTYHGDVNGGYYMLLNYSARHKLFNARDGSEETSQAILSVTHWMLRPEPPQTKRSDNEKIEQIEKTEAPKRLIYESYSPHDCESWYSCPYCNKKIGSWSLPPSKAVDNGEKMYCPYCKKEVKYPY